jgi:hypothetical protein
MAKFGVPTEEQLAKINKLAKRTFSAEEVFVFSGKSAGDMIIENRFIQLSKELLETFIMNAKEGVSWLLNHSWASWSEPVTIFGRTFDGRLEQSNAKDETVAMFLDKYIPRSETLKNGRSANSVIEDIENGVLFDTSIGWGSSKMVCSICNMDYYGGECNHLRGRIYEDADGNRKLCYIVAKNPGYLMEESGVFDGAYKGAGISMCSAGDEFETPQGKFVIVEELKELPPNTNVFGSYSEKSGILTYIKKSDHKKVFAVPEKPESKGGESKLNEKVLKMFEAFDVEFKECETKIEDAIAQLAEKYAAIPEVEPKEDQVQSYMTQEQAKEKLGKELTADAVLKLAVEGQNYHSKVSDDALAMGVRAMGNDFPKETWERTFATMETSAIIDIMKTWETQANGSIPAGRTSNPKAGQQTQSSDIPDEAFQVR